MQRSVAMVFHKRRTRALTLIQASIGVVGVAFGMVDLLVVKSMEFFEGIALWFGAWVIFTGSLGFILTAHEYPARKQWLLGSFFGFSLASCALAVYVAYLYIPLVINYTQNRSGTRVWTDTFVIVCSVISVLAVAEFFVGGWSAVCCCQGCYFCGGSPRTLDDSSRAAYLDMAMQDTVAAGSHVLVEVPGAPPAIVQVQAVYDLDPNDSAPLSQNNNQILY